MVPLVALGVRLGVEALDWHRLGVGYDVRLGQRLSWVLLLLMLLVVLLLLKLLLLLLLLKLLLSLVLLLLLSLVLLLLLLLLLLKLRLSLVLLLLLMLMMLQLKKLMHQLLQMGWQLRRSLLWGRGRGGLKGKRGVRDGLLLLMSEVEGLLMQGKG